MQTQDLVTWGGLLGLFALLWYWKRPSLSAVEAKRLVSEGALLVDVRSPSEFSTGHLPGARNIPVGELGRRANELGDRARPVILYCASGARSAAAASTLRRAGFAQVHNLGSLRNWS
jgi:rhodanese-related sulfurtransferase